MAKKNEKSKSKELSAQKSTDTMVFEESVYSEVRRILEAARNRVYSALSSEMVKAYWSIGKMISQLTNSRAEYGAFIISNLSKRLTQDFGKGFSERNVLYMRQVYEAFPNSANACAELSWSHLRILSQVEREDVRALYIQECKDGNWSVRQLDRQVHSFYAQRLLASQDKAAVRGDVQNTEKKITALDIIKDPYVLEFAGLSQDIKFRESDLESALVSNLGNFLLELGKGFSFIGRQVRISYDAATHHYIDLVFYNYILKCFVLIDLKTGTLNHGDIGQMDFYVRYYDDKKRGEGDNPTIGIILCEDKSDVVVKYSMLPESKNLFASKYKLYLPTEEELKAEMLREKERIQREMSLQED